MCIVWKKNVSGCGQSEARKIQFWVNTRSAASGGKKAGIKLLYFARKGKYV